jgi:hypothetical protein
MRVWKKFGENEPKEVLSRILVQGLLNGMRECPNARTFDAT